MKALDGIVVSRVVTLDGAAAGRATALIGCVRTLAREARLAQPGLGAYHLHDVGLQPRGDQLTVNLYFRR